MRKQDIGLRGEKKVNHLLEYHYHRTVRLCPYNSPYDCIVDGYRVEIKCAASHKNVTDWSLAWTFNIHRHGVLSEQTDFYILRLEQVPYTKYAIHMLLKAPVQTPMICVSMRSLLNQDWAAAVSDFYAFAKGQYGKKEEAA